MRRKVLRVTLSALLGMILLVSLLAAGSVYLESRKEAAADNLRDARGLADDLQAGGDLSDAFRQYALSDIRVTLIETDGTVSLDNMADAAFMENHAGREEFIKARESGAGEATRKSATLGEEYLYSAIRLSDGRVIRVSRPLRTVAGFLISIGGALLLCALAAAIVAVLIARFIANSLIKPLEALDLEHPEDNVCYEELTPLLRRLGKQQRELTARAEAERLRAREIEVITGEMREGLVLLDTSWRVLSTNAGARRFLMMSDTSTDGKRLLELNRSAELLSLIEAAGQGQAATGILRTDAAVLEAHLSPVGEKEDCRGYVLFLTDVTERHNAELIRREFSANVSHEMMTPLTSISGYAELIESGMASSEDVRGFAGRILSESHRMTALVEDVMRLSRLDEGNVRDKWEDVNLLALAKDVADSLAGKAEHMHVRVSVRGREAHIQAVRQLVWEILYNLADNAVKYNVEGGSVDIEVSADGFTVTDTGIGIPADQQAKVFERFYRVDKSHSRQIGGTGLGLSIVRHAAEYLNASVSLQSRESQGTTVRVLFPIAR